jgi:hypothetical protein
MYNNFPPFQQYNPRKMKQFGAELKHLGTELNCTKNETTQNRHQTPQFPQSEALFEIMGLKIYFDDLLLICIIFFLYQEGIKDQYLFIALILLLLS